MLEPIAPEAALDALDVFTGEISNAEARVYARLPQNAGSGDYRLAGTVVGPHCRYSRTLAASIPFVDRGPGDGLLMEAIVPDPCFWSPELPFLYRVDIEIRQAGRTIASAQRLLGIKPLAVRGSQLVFDGKNLVLRAVRWKHVPPASLSQWRELAATVDIDGPDDAWLEEASQAGVWVIARVQCPASQASAEIRRMASWPAVALIAIEAPADEPPVRAQGNYVLAQIMRDSAVTPADWCQAAMVAVANTTASHLAARPRSLPVLIERDVLGKSLAEARRACDDLQADLAGRGQFAGYIV